MRPIGRGVMQDPYRKNGTKEDSAGIHGAYVVFTVTGRSTVPGVRRSAPHANVANDLSDR